MSNFLTKEDAIQIMQGISKKTPQGIMIGNTTVGHITWQMYLMRDYLKLDGTPLANASNDYSDLLKFAQDNNLITVDTTDKSLFKYDSTNNVLTLPDFIGLVLQGGNIVEEKEAGLPNIDGYVFMGLGNSGGIHNVGLSGAFGVGNPVSKLFNENGLSGFSAYQSLDFNASRSNPIYGNSTTVQPPAIQLIPQIKYKRSTVYEGIELGENYSTEEQRIGTWIDGKPLYQRTYSITLPSATNIEVIIMDIDNTFEVKELKSVVFNNNQTLMSPFPYDSNYDINIWFSDHKIFGKQKGYPLKSGYTTIKYTKTTD